MLRRIATRNFSLLRNLELVFPAGLTAITGPSGAGKTLMFDAITFGLGGRGHRSILPTGASTAEVELELELDAAQAAELEAPWRAGVNLVVRSLSAAGRNRIIINGESARLAVLQDVAARYFDVAGQFESRVLFDSASHLQILDSFGDSTLQRQRAEYTRIYGRYTDMVTRLKTLQESAGNRLQEIDYLTFRMNELETAAVAVGETAEVQTRLRLQQNSQALLAAAGRAAAALTGEGEQSGADDMVSIAQQAIAQIAEMLQGQSPDNLHPQELGEILEEAKAALRESAAQVRDFAGALSYSQTEERTLIDRLDEIHRLERKYGIHADLLQQALDEMAQRLSILQDESADPEALEREVAALLVNLQDSGSKLSKARQRAAKVLVEETGKILRHLDFAQVVLEVEQVALRDPGPNGLEAVELLVSLNPGELPKPLAQVASGGEASRLFLGLKAALADRFPTHVMLLDEIEAGLGGDTATHIAEVLAALGLTRQVLAITHLAPVAVNASNHIVVTKAVTKGSSSSTAAEVEGDQRMAELVRMVGGEPSTEAYALVQHMLQAAAQR